MSKIITESEVEEACLEMLKGLGYKILNGSDISEGGIAEERKYTEVVLMRRLRDALERINKNKNIPKEAIEEAIKKVLMTESQNQIINNQHFHRFVTEGVPVEYKTKDGIKNDNLWLFDFENIKNNEFLAVNQFTIKEERNNRRPDVILFVNGLPIVLIELKNPADEKATIWTAYDQFQTYKNLIPAIFRFNEILIISDGLEARAGTLTANKERFTPWKAIDGEKVTNPQIDVLIKGMLNKDVLLDLIRHFIVFEADKNQKEGGIKISKKVAAYHQYHAVNKAVQSTVEAIKSDKRAGVVWHTQGSGKSLIMVFFAGKLVLQQELENPTIIVLTDRNDLDDQLFGTFSRCNELLRQEPKQAESRDEIKELLKVASGGIIFTTIQKFLPEQKGEQYPLLSDRKNIIVIADEAHRSQYDFINGFARNIRDALPNASFIGFTGTPIEKEDRSTPAVFGKYVDVYDVEQAVEDGVTVRIYYESRLAKLELKPEEMPHIDKDFEEVTEGEEIENKENLKSQWARVEKIVGSSDRIRRISADIVNHWENRLSILEGKAMIVCMSRRICVELHNEIIKIRHDWYDKDDNKGIIKVIMTGSSSDSVEWQEHIRTKQRRKDIGERMKDPSDPLKIVIVRDMWLTGFDAPCLHTMYLDKPMQGHTLMQAIARVNRVFKDKPGGLIVDYIGIAYDLKKALADYTQSGGRGKPAFDQEEAVAIMQEKYETVCILFHNFDYKKFFIVKLTDKMQIIVEAMEHLFKQEDGKNRYLKNVSELLKAFSLAVPNEEALKIRDDVGFFQAVRSAIVKNTGTKEGCEHKDYETAIKQIISKAIVSDRVIDIFAAAGLKKLDISILSEEFLAEVKEMPHKNLAFEMLKKLLNDEIRIIQKKNLVQAKSFVEMLDKAIKAYTNRSIETAEIIEQLMEIARKMRDEQKRGEKLGLNDDEVAFYDVLADHEGVREIMGDETLMIIARDLAENIRKSVKIDWTIRESVQAQMKVTVKRILRKYGYPLDKQQKATETVLEQAKLLCKDLTD
ncbi:MAG: DEAD/DEAH box helicase [Candidatus Altiarchaeales archaeon HGW-Altiarchaeales-1]|nr:MAG: DEAD/DEAH box helicase [Candidatus Altiarchaeales archaeon HGW-Altiarchaeales-1]